MSSADRLTYDVPKIIHEVIDGEVMVVRNDTGIYYSIAGIGAEIWCAAGGRTVADAAAVLTERRVTEIDIEPVVAHLVDLGLERIVGPGEDVASAPIPEDVPVADIEPAAIESYTDMQDLLLFDPIHEVTDDGWPHAAPG